MNASKSSWLRNVLALGPTEQEKQAALERARELSEMQGRLAALDKVQATIGTVKTDANATSEKLLPSSRTWAGFSLASRPAI